MVVLKLGGTSVADAGAIEAVVLRLHARFFERGAPDRATWTVGAEV